MIARFEEWQPQVDSSVFVAPSAVVIGRVHLQQDVSVWYQSVLRGDVGSIVVGPRTNIQDGSVVHVTTERFHTTLGSDVTVGHQVILHGCHIGNRVLVGMGSIIMDGVTIGDDCLIGAGSLMTPGAQVPSGMLVFGRPGKPIRALSNEERRSLIESSAHYVELARRHAQSIKS